MRAITVATAVVAVALAGFAVAGCGSDGDDAGGDAVTVQLDEVSGSGQSGTATLTAEGDGAEDVLDTLTELLTTDHDQDAAG